MDSIAKRLLPAVCFICSLIKEALRRFHMIQTLKNARHRHTHKLLNKIVIETLLSNRARMALLGNHERVSDESPQAQRRHAANGGPKYQNCTQPGAEERRESHLRKHHRRDNNHRLVANLTKRITIREIKPKHTERSTYKAWSMFRRLYVSFWGRQPHEQQAAAVRATLNHAHTNANSAAE